MEKRSKEWYVYCNKCEFQNSKVCNKCENWDIEIGMPELFVFKSQQPDKQNLTLVFSFRGEVNLEETMQILDAYILNDLILEIERFEGITTIRGYK